MTTAASRPGPRAPLCACAAGLLLAGGCGSPPAGQSSAGQAPPRAALARLADEVRSWVAAGELVGAELIVLQHGEALLHEAWGHADREAGRPMGKNGVISVKSMTKPVLATAVLMLADDGALSLDDPLTAYLPDWPGDRGVVLRDLLAHTSGDSGRYADGGYNVYDFPSLAAWVADWAAVRPDGRRGEFAYSNFNYAALGYVVERVTGAPVERFLERRIFRPLGMAETWPRFSPDAAWARRVPARYRWNPDAGGFERFWCNTDPQPWRFFPAAFGLWMTGLDFAKLAQLWLDRGRAHGEVLLSAARIDEALRPHGRVGDALLFGLGWYLGPARSPGGAPTELRHGGADGSICLVYPASDAVVLLLTHCQGREHCEALHNRVCMLGLFDQPGPHMQWARELDVTPVTLTGAERARYAGTYRAAPQGGPAVVTRVHEQDGRMVIRMGSEGSRLDVWSHLVPLGDHRFAAGRYDDAGLVGLDASWLVRFVVTDGHAVELVSEYAGEVETRGRRVPD